MSNARTIANSLPNNSLCPAGVIFPYVNATAPTGWLVCDGSAVSRSTYAALFAIVGTSYGSGDGSTTFNLPNIVDRVPVGKSGGKAIGTSGGSATATPSIGNTTLSTSQIPSHGHQSKINSFAGDLGFVAGSGGADGSWYGFNDAPDGANHQGNPYGGDSGAYATATGGGGSHNHTSSSISVEQPWVSVNYIIKH